MKILPPYLVKSEPISTTATALAAQRIRMDVIANNMANIHTTRNAKGEFAPYLRKEVLFQSQQINPNKPDEQGVLVHSIQNNQAPLNRIYDPKHPESDEKGYRFEPNVQMPREMVHMLEASRSYEANLKAMKIANSAKKQTVDILDKNP
ncbi:MAG: flagellar basal body rod protein FlgC [Planctomycetes bacterium]|nr:flagellar basal body rod protein FlgC [Planctomycetota bacterium]